MPRAILALSLFTTTLLAGCVDNAVLIPSSDTSLNKTAATFATDAKACFPYPVEAQRGKDLDIRAEVGYMWNVINLVNYAGQDWENVELWVNKQYVLPLAHLESGKTKRISFKMLYDNEGSYFPLGGTMIKSLELKKDGMMFTVPTQIGG